MVHGQWLWIIEKEEASEMISPYDVLTSSGRYPSRPLFSSQEIRENATETARRVSALIADFIKTCVSSGYRTPDANSAAGGARQSNHMKGTAVDLFSLPHYLASEWERDPKNCLLEKHDLYMEHPDYTKTWCHLQTTPTKSGRRVFIP